MRQTSPVFFPPFRAHTPPKKKPKHIHTIIHIPKGGSFLPLSLSLSFSRHLFWFELCCVELFIAPPPFFSLLSTQHPAQDSVRPTLLELDMKAQGPFPCLVHGPPSEEMLTNAGCECAVDEIRKMDTPISRAPPPTPKFATRSTRQPQPD